MFLDELISTLINAIPYYYYFSIQILFCFGWPANIIDGGSDTGTTHHTDRTLYASRTHMGAPPSCV
jgi:hypothetical protein